MHTGKFWLEQSREICTSCRRHDSREGHYFWNSVLAARQTCNFKEKSTKKVSEHVMCAARGRMFVCQFDVSYFVTLVCFLLNVLCYMWPRVYSCIIPFKFPVECCRFAK
jgi:hypothetical protein